MSARLLLAIALLLPVAAASAQTEDEAHRADRLRTQQLNRQAADAVARRDRGQDSPDRTAPDYAAARHDYDEARADYQRRLAQWRARVAACQRGDYSACDDR